MNVLIVSQYFWPETFRINDIALGLKERGHQVTVLTGLPNYPEGKLFDGYKAFNKIVEYYNDIKIIRAPLTPRGKGDFKRLILNYLSFAFSSCLMAPFFCRGKIDIIIVFENSPITVGLPAIVLKRLKSIPIIFWVQDLWPESLSATGAVNSKLILKLVAFLVRFIYYHCDQILGQSRAFFPSIKKYGGNANRIAYFPNTAEELYQPVTLTSDAPERKNIPPGFCIMFAGNIGAAQDFNTIIRAAELLKNNKNIHWVILGDGRMRPWVEEQVQARGLAKTVHLLGRHAAATMPRYFALADALLVTLKKEPIFSLTIPSKIQSYLACAKPIIAALEGEGARIINESKSGLTCQPEAPELMAKAVLRLYKMPESARQEMGRRGRDYFEKNFERSMLFDRLEGWMEGLHQREGR